MQNSRYLDEYSCKSVCQNLFLSLIIYGFGVAILWLIHYGYGIGYCVLVLLTFVCIWKFRCTDCYYYGKKCYSGMGKLAAFFFKKHEPSDFMVAKNLIPGAILSVITLFAPIIGGIIDLILSFRISQLILLIFYLILSIPISGMMRPINCARCKQGQLGCPAYNTNQKDLNK